MALTAGIIGLPNVGKSTLFNAITNSSVLAENYPFATIDPNVGVVAVPDERLTAFAEYYHPEKTIPTTFEFTDIAGLVRGASKGEGLGNRFLANIRQTDAIIHVVRCFDDPSIEHVEGSVDPLRDIEAIDLELCLADLETVENRLAKVSKKAQAKDREAETERNVLTKLKDALERGEPVRRLTLSEDERRIISGYGLLTGKPVIFAANLSEDDIASPEKSSYFAEVKAYAEKEDGGCIAVSAKIEEELSALAKEEKSAFLAELGIAHSGLDQIITSAYHLLGLRTFFTVGKPECRAWTFHEGMKAPECAGIIHSDFAKGFIKAEVYGYDDFLRYPSEAELKEHGLIRIEGKDYRMADGDVVYFRFNV